ncbi:hypothetical protein GYH30_004529 [Glycine max]|uniref:Uncharacterized protein n=1 Tax=Glycine max TaxID=3847 RepID=A0A0R0KYQ8_SOYBN|nr:hypothetical protein GYH30_004529 [Glycine max]
MENRHLKQPFAIICNSKLGRLLSHVLHIVSMVEMKILSSICSQFRYHGFIVQSETWQFFLIKGSKIIHQITFREMERLPHKESFSSKYQLIKLKNDHIFVSMIDPLEQKARLEFQI